MDPNTLSADYIDDHLSVLAQKHCRFVLYYFEESSETVSDIDDLAAYLRSRDETADDTVTRTLHHATLPALAAVGAIDYDPRNGTVRYRGHSTLEKWLSHIAADERGISQSDLESTPSRPDTTDGSDTVVFETYKPEQDRTLTDAVLDAIETCKGEDISYTDFTLFNDIEPEALNNVFKDDAEPGTTLSFSTDGVHVELWGDGGVEIRVSE